MRRKYYKGADRVASPFPFAPSVLRPPSSVLCPIRASQLLEQSIYVFAPESIAAIAAIASPRRL